MAKGQDFERLLCHQLSKWWTQEHPNGVQEDCFWRTSGSGGRATARAKKNLSTRNSHGDICALDEVGAPLLKVIALEAKRGYNRVSLHNLLDGTKSSSKEFKTYEEWIAQAERSRVGSGALYWAIIHRRDRCEALLIMPSGLWTNLSPRSRFQFLFRGPAATIHLEDGNTINVVQLKDFLAVVKPDDILAMLGKRPDNTKEATAQEE